MRKDILKYCKGCSQCAKHRVEKRKFIEQSFKPGAQPMEFIFHGSGRWIPPTIIKRKPFMHSQLSVCWLILCFAFLWRTSQPVKLSQHGEIILHSHSEWAERCWTDNGTEFKNSLFTEVAKELGLERKIYSPPYRPQSNGVLEGFHKFLKASFAKHISRHKEWDDVAAMAAASYNYMPNQHSKEAPFFVMFGRDAVTNIGHLTVPRYRHMGTEDLILDLEIMSNIYQCSNYKSSTGETSCAQTKSWRHTTVTKNRPSGWWSGSRKRPCMQNIHA